MLLLTSHASPDIPYHLNYSDHFYAAMVTSTSTPASMLMMICLTTSVGALRLFQLALLFLSPTSILNPRFALSREQNSLDQTLVDPHLEAIPGLGTLTTGRLAGSDLQGLGGKTDGSLDTEVLRLGALDELLGYLLKGRDLAAGQGDSDLVGFLIPC